MGFRRGGLVEGLKGEAQKSSARIYMMWEQEKSGEIRQALPPGR